MKKEDSEKGSFGSSKVSTTPTYSSSQDVKEKSSSNSSDIKKVSKGDVEKAAKKKRKEARTAVIYDQLEYYPSQNNFLMNAFLITFGFVLLTLFINVVVEIITPLKKIVQDYSFLFLAFGIFLIVFISIAIVCCVCLRSKGGSYFNLAVALIGINLLTVYVTVVHCTYGIVIILIPVLLNILLCLLLAKIKFDFRSDWLYVCLLLSTLVGIGCAGGMVYAYSLTSLQIFFVILGIIVHGIVLPIQIHMIIGGKYIDIGNDELRYCAYMFYMSFLDMTMKLLIIWNILDEY